MAENEKAEELIRFVRSLGFDGGKLEKNIREQHEKFSPYFTVTHKISFGEELMRYELRFVHDRQFMAYRLESYEASHRPGLTIDHKNINGIDTGKLEESMSEINWDSYFKYEMYGGEYERDLKPVFDALWKLTDNHRFDGADIQSKLIYKYWPSANWNDEADKLRFAYEKKNDFKASEFGICNATLAYNIVSGRLDKLYGLIEKSGILQYPGLDLHNLLATYLSGNADSFDVTCSANVKEGTIDFRIPVQKVNNDYYADTNHVTFIPYPEILHSVVDGIDTAILEEQIKKIDWDKDELFVIDDKEDLHLLPHISEIKEKVLHVGRHEDGRDIATYLQIKYWSSASFMGTQVDQSTWERWESSVKLRQRFTLDTDTKTIANLMQGYPVQAKQLHSYEKNSEGWLIIDQASVSVEGLNIIEFVAGLTRAQVELMVNMLPLDGTLFVGDIVRSITQGEQVPLNIVGVEKKQRIVVAANPKEKRLDVFTPEGLPIPFNFRLDPDWKLLETTAHQISQGDSRKAQNYPFDVPRPEKNKQRKSRGFDLTKQKTSMKIELKNLELSKRVRGSFIAHLYINDAKAGIVHNMGGEHNTVYHHISEEGKQLIAEAEIHCRMMPENNNTKDGAKFSLTDYLDQVADVRNRQTASQKSSRNNRQKQNRKGI